MRKLEFCVVLFLTATLFLSACGSADPTAVPTPTVAATAPSAPPTVVATPTTAAEPTLIATVQETITKASTTTQVTTVVATETKPAQPASQGDAEKGAELFVTTCAACHGPKGEGVKGLGKDMTTSKFIAGLSDTDLLAFVKQGRSTTDPLNTTGVMMPPKGGNPALTDAELLDIIAFIRTIHK